MNRPDGLDYQANQTDKTVLPRTGPLERSYPTPQTIRAAGGMRQLLRLSSADVLLCVGMVCENVTIVIGYSLRCAC